MYSSFLRLIRIYTDHGLMKKDYTGQRINSFTVVAKTDKKHGRSSVYLCKCDCGNPFEVHTGYINQKYGCDACSKTRHYSEAWKSRRIAGKANPRRTELSRLYPASVDGVPGAYSVYVVQCAKAGARQRRIPWALNDVFAFEIMIQPCTYCGDAPTYPQSRNGIDRVVNERGYEPNNVVPSCKVCNYWKSTMSVEDFKAHVAKVHTHLSTPPGS